MDSGDEIDEEDDMRCETRGYEMKRYRHSRLFLVVVWNIGCQQPRW